MGFKLEVMSFKKINLITVSALLFISFINAQERLNPFNVSIFNSCSDYYIDVIKKLSLNNCNEDNQGKFILIPSFGSELGLMFTKNDTVCKLVLNTVEHSIAHNRDSNLENKTITFEKNIDSISFSIIIKLVNHSIKKSKYSKHYGMDGTNYYFSNQYKTATIWSPKKDTKTYELVKIMEEIVALVKDENIQTIKFSADLTERIKKLLRK